MSMLVSCQVNHDLLGTGMLKARFLVTFVIPYLIRNPGGVVELDSRLRGNDMLFT